LFEEIKRLDLREERVSERSKGRSRERATGRGAAGQTIRLTEFSSNKV
jgi:hypothetical protein